MGAFDEYNQIKKEKNDFLKHENEWKPVDIFDTEYASQTDQETKERFERELYEKQQKKGLGKNVEDAPDSLSYVEESIRLKEANSTFQERTEYYFKDTKYMEAKEARYRSLADDSDGSVSEFAKKHTNRSAKKRKKSAKEAADNFSQAKKLEEKFNDAGGDELPPEDAYECRKEIMQARLKGMISAAKVKATSKKDEEYRIAKAKLSCYSTLFEQAEHLKERKSEYFDQVFESLNKEIESAKKSLKKYGSNPNAEWMEALGCNDTESLQKDIKESGNPHATIEDAKLARIFTSLALEARRPEYVEAQKICNETNVFGQSIVDRRDELIAPAYIIRRDKQGNPINKEELRKQQWNKKWLDACKDPEKKFERKKLLIESFERFKKLDIPSPQELKKKGIEGIIKENPFRVYELNNYWLRIDNIRHIDPIVNEYCEFDKEFRAKLEAGENFSLLVVKHLEYNHNLYQGTYRLQKGDKFEEMSADEIKKSKREEQKELNDFIEGYKKDYAPIAPALEERKKALSYEKNHRQKSFDSAKKYAKEKKADKLFNEKTYEKYLEFYKANQQMENPYYREKYEPVFKKLGGNNDISRLAGAMLRNVHFDDNWIPISKEDMAAHEWNMNYLNNLKTYIAGPDLSIHDKKDIEKADKLLEDNEITEEQYKDRGIFKKLDKKKAESARILDEMVQEEFKKTYCEDNFHLPSPVGIMEAVKLLKNHKRGEPVPEIPLFENMIKDTDKYITLAQKTLSFEGTYKNLPFANEFLKKNPLISKYHSVLGHIQLFVNTYYSHKYGVNPATGSTAEVAATALEPKDLVELAEGYKSAYDIYKEELKKGNS